MLIQIDQGAAHEVAAEILQDYILEQCRLRQWLIVACDVGWDGGGGIDLLDQDGGEHVIRITAKAEGE